MLDARAAQMDRASKCDDLGPHKTNGEGDEAAASDHKQESASLEFTLLGDRDDFAMLERAKAISL